MGSCYNGVTNRDEACSIRLTVYVAVGILVPLGILLIVVLAYVYVRCRQRQLRRQQLENGSTNNINLENNEQDPNRQQSLSYPYPPRYSVVTADVFGKPPSYEQTLQQLSETNTHASAENIPVTIITTPVVPPGTLPESTRHQTQP